MAYPNYNYYPNQNWYYQPAPVNGTQIAQPQQPQIQNGGMVFVRSESEILNYPVAPGNSMMFKIESEPYVYVKTKDFSQMTAPTLEKYKLVKEEQDTQNQISEAFSADTDNPTDYAKKSEIEELRAAYAKLKDDVYVMRKAISLFADKETDHE